MNNKIKILVGYHEPAILFKDEILTPINGGRAILEQRHNSGEIADENYEWMIANTVGDNSGDNISEKNATYNELTCIYWAWKNYEKLGNPEYIGFEHYRRHLIFSNLRESKNRWTVDFESVHEIGEYLKDIGYNKDLLYRLLTNYSGIVARHKCSISVRQQYSEAVKFDAHNFDDLVLCENIIKEKYPTFYGASQKYLDGSVHYFCNTFILKREIFLKYCEFLFGVLKNFEQLVNFTDRPSYQKRFFVSERLTGIFFTYLKLQNEKIKEVPLSFIKECGIDFPINPIFDKKERPVVCVFAVDKKYLPQLHVTAGSLLKNCDKQRNYELCIMHTGLEQNELEKFLRGFEIYNNVRFRFINVKRRMLELEKAGLYIEIHVSVATYYRFLIQEIFCNYDEVLYLDSDLIILDDISKLFDFNLEGKYIGAAHDIRESLACKLNLKVSKGINWRKYVEQTLNIKDYNDYFQAGVLKFSISNMRDKVNLRDICISELQRIKTPILSDQDVLNSALKGFVSYFDSRWNIEWQIKFEFPEAKKLMSSSLYKKWSQAHENKGIIHYASSIKPWQYPSVPDAEYWWEYARGTVYYEEFVVNLMNDSRRIRDYLLNKTARKGVKNILRRSLIRFLFRN